MYSELANFAKTTAETQILLNELEEILAASYKTDGGMVDSLKKIRTNVANVIGQYLQGEGISRDQIQAILEKLKSRKTLTLTVALEPTEELVAEISAWVKANVGEDIVLEFLQDENLIGGATVSFEGRFGDFSMKKILDEYYNSIQENSRLSVGR